MLILIYLFLYIRLTAINLVIQKEKPRLKQEKAKKELFSHAMYMQIKIWYFVKILN